MTIQKDQQNFSMPAGTSRKIKFTVAMEGTLAGSTIKWWMARVPTTPATDAFVKKSATIVITGDRTFEVPLLPADTKDVPLGEWYHEAEVTDADGNVDVVASGKVKLTPKLIRSA